MKKVLLFLLFCSGIVNAQTTWNTTGNSGTDPLLNFIGTTDLKDIVFRRNNIFSGRISAEATSFGFDAMPTSNSKSTAFGRSALKSLVSGVENSAFGAYSLSKFTSGSANTAVGSQSLFNDVLGSFNTAIGCQALFNNLGNNSTEVGWRNTAVGVKTLFYNTTGVRNVGFGVQSLYGNTTGNGNVGVGCEALEKNTSGNLNTSLGTYSGGELTSGLANIFIGSNSGRGLQTGSGNVIIGTYGNSNIPYTLNNTLIVSVGTSTTERFRITDAGRMGLGTTTPLSKLDIKGNLAIGSTYSGTNAAPLNGLIVEGNVGIGATVPANKLQITANGANASGLRFTNLTSTSLPISPSNGRVLTLNATGDVVLTSDVGSIGTTTNSLTNSTNTLTSTVNGILANAPIVNSVVNTIIANQLTTTVNGVPSVAVTLPAAGIGCNIFTCDGTIVTTPSGLPNNPTLGLRTVTMGNNNLHFLTNATYEENNVGTGRIYIGSSINNFPIFNGNNSHYRLLVEGGILTEKVKIALSNTANWADYVFANDYKLMPLTELEAFVKENNHLPGIDSAEDLVKNGLDIADMQAKQMGKIEELTLHLIKQNKEIEELKAQVRLLISRSK